MRSIIRNSLVYLKHGRNMCVMELGGSLSFPVKPGAIILTGQGRRRKHLDGDRSVQLRIVGAVHNPHSTAANLGGDLIVG